jgi:hypothetical protein
MLNHWHFGTIADRRWDFRCLSFKSHGSQFLANSPIARFFCCGAVSAWRFDNADVIIRLSKHCVESECSRIATEDQCCVSLCLLPVNGRPGESRPQAIALFLIAVAEETSRLFRCFAGRSRELQPWSRPLWLMWSIQKARLKATFVSLHSVVIHFLDMRAHGGQSWIEWKCRFTMVDGEIEGIDSTKPWLAIDHEWKTITAFSMLYQAIEQMNHVRRSLFLDQELNRRAVFQYFLTKLTISVDWAIFGRRSWTE